MPGCESSDDDCVHACRLAAAEYAVRRGLFHFCVWQHDRWLERGAPCAGCSGGTRGSGARAAACPARTSGTPAPRRSGGRQQACVRDQLRQGIW
jgi:hypothetical protein